MIKRTVRRWSQDTAVHSAEVFFETADWYSLCEPHEEDINVMTDCMTDYINFYVATPLRPEQ